MKKIIMFVVVMVSVCVVLPVCAFAEKVRNAGLKAYFSGADEKVGPKIGQIKTKTGLLRADLKKISDSIETKAKTFNALKAEQQRALDKFQKELEMGIPVSDVALDLAKVRKKISDTVKNVESDAVGIFEVIKPGDLVKKAIHVAVPSFDTDQIHAGQISAGVKIATGFFDQLTIEAAAKDYEKIVTELLAIKAAEKAKNDAIAQAATAQVLSARQQQESVRWQQQQAKRQATQVQKEQQAEARRAALRTFLDNI